MGRYLRKYNKFHGATIIGGAVRGRMSMSRLVRKVRTNTLRLKTAISSEKRRLNTIIQAFDSAIPLSAQAQALGCITLTAQGDGTTNRDGNQIHVYKIRVYGHFQKVAENAGLSYVRVMLIRTPESCGAAITSALVLNNDQSNDLLQQDLDLARNYTICADRMYVLGDSAHGTEQTLRSFDFTYSPPKGEITGYDGVAATIASTTKNHYFVLMQQSAAATSDVKGYCNVAVYFNP